MTLAPARALLLEWYDHHKRDLPWRRTRDPYAVWVSEIMLQQTRVDTVIPYYERFLARFPTPAALARASEDEVMSAWSGLGYYRRARLLHQGVREVHERYGGVVPTDPVARLALPGVGRYTAGAIGSIAFDRPEPIVDGNVARVLSRYLGLDAPLGSPSSEKRLWAHAQQFADGPRPGELNQAIMELGALVCTKAQPRCETCPWQAECIAHQQSRVAELPVPRARKSPVPVALVTLVAEQGRGKRRGTWLVRESGTLFGGLWSPPMREGCGLRAAQALATHHQLEGTLEERRCARIRHVLSHRDLDIEVYRMEAHARENEQRRRVSATQLDQLGISALTRKILQAASE